MTLLLGVLLLASLSLVVLAAASASSLQVRMSHNSGSEQQAMQAARSANAWAERWLLGQNGSTRIVPCSAACPPEQVIRAANSYPPFTEYQPESWWLEHAHADGFDPVTGQRLAPRTAQDMPVGRWLIEEIHHHTQASQGLAVEISYYRILARAISPYGGHAVVVESTLARPWGQAEWQDPLPRETDTALFCLDLLPAIDCGRRSWRRRL